MFTTSDKYLGYETFYENEKDIQQKLEKFVQIMGILNNTFKPTCSPDVF
jgi:transposase